MKEMTPNESSIMNLELLSKVEYLRAELKQAGKLIGKLEHRIDKLRKVMACYCDSDERCDQCRALEEDQKMSMK